ncbi:MAG: hypothetical protein QNJ78_01475 [Gammaproteobacteria bacterium]|nr:hypothetical protein [Gammaproteobacteria bacterium]
MLDRIALCRLIPHAGGMCLLDEVLNWDQDSVVCLSRSHRRGDNPLRELAGLDGMHAIEYGAQAMAVHGGLLAKASGSPIQAGYLVSVSNVKLRVDRLDLIESPLIVSARQLMADGGNLLYQFEVSAESTSVATGRAAVIARGEVSG